MASESGSPLTAVAIVELDTNKDVLLSWCYPSLVPVELEKVVPAQAEPILLQKPLVGAEAKRTSYFTRYGGYWLYGCALAVGPESCPRVTGFSIVVVATVFDPEQFGALAQLLAKQYFVTGEPVRILECYISAFSIGSVSAADTVWRRSEYDSKMALLNNASLTGLLRTLGPETVKLWSALLLKKRVIVYCNRLVDLLRIMRTIPQLVWHRQDWDVLRPWIAATTLEAAEFTAAGVYVVGVTDAAFRGRSDMYDLFIDVSAKTFYTPESSKSDFELGPPHRDIATGMTEIIDNASITEEAAIKLLAVKTNSLIAKVKSLPQPITKESLQNPALKLTPSLVRFLYGVALAEPSVATA